MCGKRLQGYSALHTAAGERRAVQAATVGDLRISEKKRGTDYLSEIGIQ